MRNTRANGAEKRNGSAADGWRNWQTVRAGLSTRRLTRARVFLSNNSMSGARYAQRMFVEKRREL
jgi:hypothetical protein